VQLARVVRLHGATYVFSTSLLWPAGGRHEEEVASFLWKDEMYFSCCQMSGTVGLVGYLRDIHRVAFCGSRAGRRRIGGERRF